MIDLLDDVNFTKVPSHAGSVLEGAPVRVLGTLTHTYEVREGLFTCFAMCSAASDCRGITHHPLDRTCAFSHSGGRLVKADAKGEVFIRQHRHPAAPVPELPSMQPLASSDAAPIFLVPNFASRSECMSLIKFASECLSRKLVPDGEDRAIVGSQWCPVSGRRTADLLSRMEERIARLTGLPSHEEEETLSFRRLEAVGADGPWFANLHHDKNKQDGRVATVIVYLSSSSADADGGHTIFPALPRRRDDTPDAGWQTDADLERFQSAARQAYAQGRLALGCRDHSAGCGDVGGLAAHAEAECERALQGAQRGVAVRPRVGSALVFWSEHPNGQAADTMWHTACNPRHWQGGGARWVMQKFKTPPQPHEGETVGSAAKAGAVERDEL